MNLLIKKIFYNKFFILFLSIILILYFCEFSLHFINKEKQAKLISNKKNFYTKKNISLLDFYETKKDTHVLRMFAFNNIEDDKVNKLKLFPLSGFSNKPTITCNELGYFNYINSDKYGFFNKSDRHKNLISNILIGDSFGMGDCVSEDETIVEILNKKNIETLNLSYGNTSTLLQFAILVEYGFHLKPKNIFWLYYDNDIDDLYYEIQSLTLKSYLYQNKSYNLKNKDHEKNKFLYKNLLKKLDLYKKESSEKLNQKKTEILNKKNIFYFDNLIDFFYDINDLRFIYFPNKKNKKSLKVYEEILKKSKEIVERNDGNLFVILIPDIQRFISVKFQDATKNKANVIQILKKLNIKYLDLYSEILKDYKNPLELYPFGSKSHFNNKGYKFTSKEIEKLISN